MAFKLFNYDKTGPGISKNAPEKRKFVIFFETFFRNFWKFMPINLVYFAISLPIITNGMAMAGITHVTRNTALDKHSFGLSDFFETIKKNWIQSLLVGVLNIIITIVLIFNFSFFFGYNGNEIFKTIGLGFSMFVGITFAIMRYYIWTLMITFSFSISKLYINSFKFVFINFWKNLLCLITEILMYAVYVVAFYLIWQMSYNFFTMALALEIIIFVVTFPCYRALMIQYIVFPPIVKYIIEPYYKEHPFEDIEKRRDLGLEIEELKKYDEDGNLIEEEETVFEDNI